MAYVAQFTGCAAFAIESCISIGLRLMGVVAALLAFEVAPIAVGLVVIVTAHKALMAGPGLDQRTVDAEVLAG